MPRERGVVNRALRAASSRSTSSRAPSGRKLADLKDQTCGPCDNSKRLPGERTPSSLGEGKLQCCFGSVFLKNINK